MEESQQTDASRERAKRNAWRFFWVFSASLPLAVSAGMVAKTYQFEQPIVNAAYGLMLGAAVSGAIGCVAMTVATEGLREEK